MSGPGGGEKTGSEAGDGPILKVVFLAGYCELVADVDEAAYYSVDGEGYVGNSAEQVAVIPARFRIQQDVLKWKIEERKKLEKRCVLA